MSYCYCSKRKESASLQGVCSLDVGCKENEKRLFQDLFVTRAGAGLCQDHVVTIFLRPVHFL